jgi:penicillin-binding protein 1A
MAVRRASSSTSLHLPGRVALPHWPKGAVVASRIGLVVFIAALLVAAAVAPFVGLATLALSEVDHHFLALANEPLLLPPEPQRSTIYSGNGSVLARPYRTFDRQVLSLSQISPAIRRAVLAAEDHSFYQHGAIDLASIVRAAIANFRAGQVVEGGSTITEQLAKDVITGSAETMRRKVLDAEDAIRLERTYTRNQILDMYLNEIYLGHGMYGVGTAALFYFGRPASRVSLAQAALVAGMIASPGMFDPILHPGAARARRNEVLASMSRLGWIGPSLYRQSLQAPLGLSRKDRARVVRVTQPYWVQFVTQEFLQSPQFGATYADRARELFQGGLRIYTTLRPRLQAEAEASIRRRMTGPRLPQSAVVSVVPQTGAITTMAVGNQPFSSRHQFNLASEGHRTAGSAFKAFTLAAALEDGISPFATYDGTSPRTIPHCGGGQSWTVANAEPGSGTYPLWLATADSVNVVFAQVIDQVTPQAVADVAHRMGIVSPLTAVCPLTLGTSPVSPLEMTSAYATLADDGIHCVPFAISRIVGPTGQVIYRARPTCSRALPASIAAEETAMLRGVVSFGTGTAANLCPACRPQAGKTGTGENYQDAWFMGYVPQLCTGVWVGYAAAELPMRDVPGYGEGFGGTLAAPIWHDYMAAALRGVRVEGFPTPPIPIPGGPTMTGPPTTVPVGPSPIPTPTPTPTP